MHPPIDTLILQARQQEAARQHIATLDLTTPLDFGAYCRHVFGPRVFTTTTWQATVVPNPWYSTDWSLELALQTNPPEVYLLNYAWHGPDVPCWELLPAGLLIMVDHLLLALDEIRPRGPWPRTADWHTGPFGWSENAARPR